MERYLADESKGSWCRNASVPRDEWKMSGKMNGRFSGIEMAGYLVMNGGVRAGMEGFLADERKGSWFRNASVPGDEWKVSGQKRGRAPGVGMPIYVPGDKWKVFWQMRGRAPGVEMPMYLVPNGRCPSR
jgi:hypothetical protein